MYLHLGLLYPICKTWHLFTLKCRPHLKDHSWSLAKSSCKVIEFLVMLKIWVSSANIRQKLFMLSAMSFMKIVNKTGPRILPCGIPLNTSALDESFFPTRTLWVLSYRKPFTQLCTPPVIPYIISLLSSRSCGTESKAFLKSKYTISVGSRWSMWSVRISITSKSCVAHDLFFLKPCWQFAYKLCSFICFTIAFLTKDSSTLQITLVRLTGL